MSGAEQSGTGRSALVALAAVAVVLVGVLVGVLTSAAVGANGDDADGAEPAGPPTIVMRGEGTAIGVPDELSFTMAVRVTRSDVAPAMDEASRTMSRMLDALKPFGVRGKDVQTTGLSVNPVYDYSGGTTVLTGYAIGQRARVSVRDLAKAGRAISAVAEAGGNAVRLSGIRLDIADRGALLEKARRAAMTDARSRAEQYADAGGQRLGAVLSVKEVSAPAPRSEGYAAFDQLAAKSARLAAVPIRAGKRDLDVRIRVVWELRAAR